MKLFAAFVFGNTLAQEACEFTDTTVDCNGGILSVAVPLCAITDGGFDPAAVYMGANTCNGTIDEVNSMLVFEADAAGCEVLPTTNDTHINYESTIMTSGGGHSNSVISRQFGLELDFSCAVEREVTVSIENGLVVNVNHFVVDLGEQFGSFEATMGVFMDDSFVDPVPVNHTFNIPDEVFIGITLENSDLAVSLDTCTAYMESDVSRSSGYDLIASACSVDQDTQILEDNQGPFAGFQFTSFEFVDNQDPIVIECDVVICDPDGDECVVCASRKRRSAASLNGLTTSVTLNMVNLNP